MKRFLVMLAFTLFLALLSKLLHQCGVSPYWIEGALIGLAYWWGRFTPCK